MAVGPSLPNVAGYRELIGYIDINAAAARLAVVVNATGATIAKGSVVYVSGASGNVPSVAKARANAVSTLPAFGIVPADILSGAAGNCQFSGVLDSIDTSAFNTGDLLYVSAATAGLLTATAPTHPNVSQLVAIVTKKDAVAGAMFVFPGSATHGQEVGTLSDTFKIGAGTAGAKVLAFVNAFVGSLSWTPTAARALILPDASDTLMGKATTDVLTNKTFDTAGTGNVLKIDATAVSQVTGSGNIAVLSVSPALTTPGIDAATGESLTLSAGFGCNGKAAQTAFALGAAATDLASVITLANNIRGCLISDGIGS